MKRNESSKMKQDFLGKAMERPALAVFQPFYQWHKRNTRHLEIKFWNGYDIFLAMILSLCTVIMTRMNVSNGVFGTIKENYVGRFGIQSVLLFLALLVLFYAVIKIVDPFLYARLKKISLAQDEEHAPQIMKFWGIFLIIAWLPYYLSYYPGGVYSDTFSSISFHMDGVLTNRHPFLYNLLIGMAIDFGDFLGKDLTWSMGFFFGVQMLLLAAEILYVLHWMLDHKIKRTVRIAVMLFFTVFPLIPLYGVSIWKDTPFCMAMLLFMMFFVDLYFDLRQGRQNLRHLAGAGVGMLLTAFTRNNGIYVVVFIVLVFILATFREKFKKKYASYGALVFSILLICLLQGPVYRWIGVQKTEDVESLGIPLQQICSVVAYDGEITEEQMESIKRFIPGSIKKNFAPCVVDTIKWTVLDGQYLHGHKQEFIRLWLQLLVQNPGIYIKQYLLQTCGFWNVDITSSAAYVQNYVWQNGRNVSQTDYFEKWFGFSFQHFVGPRQVFISSAWFFWAFFLCGIFMMKHFGWKTACLTAPQLGVWLTLMAATPISVSLRYISPLMFTLPFVVILPILLQREQEEKAKEEQG